MFRVVAACVILCLCFTNIHGVSDEVQKAADLLHSTCVEETGALEDSILNARKGDFADDDKLKCYIKCLMTQTALISEDGIIDEEAVIRLMPDEFKAKAEPIIKKCGTKIGSSTCENAWLTSKCYQAADPANYFLP